MILALNYSELSSLIHTTNALGRELNQYYDNLGTGVQNKLHQVEGGMSSSLNSADYYVKNKLTQLREKESNANDLADKTQELLDIAKSVDMKVERMIQNNQNIFFQKNPDLKPSNLTLAIYSFWLGFTNIPVYGEFVVETATAWTVLRKEIRNWWECDGRGLLSENEAKLLNQIALLNIILISGGSATGLVLFNLLQNSNTSSDLWPEGETLEELKNKVDSSKKYMTSDDPEEQEEYRKWRDLFIKRYEQKYPQNAKKLDKLFKDMAKDPDTKYQEDIKNIKCIAYRAEEPYQTLLFEHIDKMKIADYNATEAKKDKNGNIVKDKNGDIVMVPKNYWSPGSNTLTLNFDEGFDNGIADPRGAYTVFFHEAGHGVDDLSRSERESFLWFKTSDDEFLRNEYKNVAGQTLNDVMIEDVRKKLTAEVNQSAGVKGIELTEEENLRIVENIMAVNSPKSEILDFDGKINKPLSDVYNDVQTSMENRLQGAIIGGISDSYGGVTNHTIEGNYQHAGTYWFNENGEVKRTASTEFFAHNFAYNMTGSEEQQNFVAEYFPNANTFMDDMVTAVEAEIKGE